MMRGFEVVFLAVFVILIVVPGTGRCGYSMESSYRNTSRRFWYIIEVESGSPPPFRDLHVEAGDADPANYELVLAPPGWQMGIAPKNDGTGEVWISFYGDEPCSNAFFKVEYSGEAHARTESDWHLTEDGDLDPNTGIIPGEDGSAAFGPWFVPVANPDLKVGVHVMPHEDRTCSRNFPSITICSDIGATCEANDVDFFPVFFDVNEFQSVEFSVEWPGTYSCVFSACAGHAGDIVWPAGTVPVEEGKDWIMIFYGECQHGPVAIPGWGWIYEPGPSVIRIVPCTFSGSITMVDCLGHGYPNEPICNFAAGIGGASGEQPCGPSASETDTWGAIKAMFE